MLTVPDAKHLIHVVAAALIDDRARILVQRRPPGKPMAGLWEFPGGKIEPRETPEAALVRELEEELGIVVDHTDCLPICFASADLDNAHLVLLLYGCRRWIGTPNARHATAFDWCTVRELCDLSMPPADGPLIDAISRFIRPEEPSLSSQ